MIIDTLTNKNLNVKVENTMVEEVNASLMKEFNAILNSHKYSQQRDAMNSRTNINTLNIDNMNGIFSVLDSENISDKLKDNISILKDMVSGLSSENNNKEISDSFNNIIQKIQELTEDEKCDMNLIAGILSPLFATLNLSENNVFLNELNSFEEIDSIINSISETSEGVDLELKDSLENFVSLISELTNSEEETISLKEVMHLLQNNTSSMESLENNLKIDEKKKDFLDKINNLALSPVMPTVLNEISNIESKNSTVLTSKILAVIQEKLQSMDTNNSNVLKLKLYPSKLGYISISLEQVNDKLVVSITGDNNDTLRFLDNFRNDFSEKLQGSFNSVDVFIGNEGNNKNSNEQSLYNYNNNDTTVENDIVKSTEKKIPVSILRKRIIDTII